MFVDYHVHCCYSDDSDAPMEEYVKQGLYLGLEELCFTDHVDYGVKLDWDDCRETARPGKELLRNVDYPKYFAELAALREKYEGQIKIRRGLELGVQSHTVPAYERLYQKYEAELDFVLLSMHEVEDLEFCTYEYQEGRTQREYNEGYYREILKVIRQFKHYSVLSHLDMIIRYDRQGVYPFAKLRDLIAEILETAIADGKGIEINTSSWHYGLRDTMPSRDILKLYRDLGGEVITVGSDAHTTEYLGSHFGDAVRIVKETGFGHICTFERMEPVFRKI